MIPNAALNWFANVLNALVDALPAWAATPDTASIHKFGDAIGGFDGFFPVFPVLNVLGFYLSVVTALLAFKGVKSIINVIRGSGA